MRILAKGISVVVLTFGLAAQAEGLAPRTSEAALRQRVEKSQWFPDYSRIEHREPVAMEARS